MEGITSEFDRTLPAGYQPVNFTNVAQQAGINLKHFQGTRSAQLPEDMGSGAAWGDCDDDRHGELFTLHSESDAVLYHSQGNGQFSDATARAGLKGVGGRSVSALFFDYDKDGLPDLLISAQASFEEAVRSLLQPALHIESHSPRLFRNQGNGDFREAAQSVGLNRSYGAFQALVSDFDRDGWTDLLLANGALDVQCVGPNVILRNEEGKKFREWSYLPGFERPGCFIGAAVADFNRDGSPDICLASNPLLRGMRRSGGLYMSRSGRRPAERLALQMPSAR